MADMEDVSKFANKIVQSTETFLLKQSSKKEQKNLSPSEKIQDSIKVQKELSNKPISLKKEAIAFLKGPLQFILGATLLATGAVGVTVFMPLALIGTGVGGAVGWIAKQGLKKEGLSQSADRLGAAAGASIGSFGSTLLVFAGLKLMADAVPKNSKAPPSKEEQLAKAIVDDAVNQITSTLENPTSKELKNALVANIQESLKNEEINPQLLEKITEELGNKINILKQEHEITVQFNHWMQPSVAEKPLSPHLRALTEGRFLPTQTVPHSPLGNKADAFERSMDLGLKNKQPLQKEPISKEIKDEMDKGSDGADPDIDPMIFEKILELPDFEYIIKKSSEKTLEEFSASPLIGEHVFPLDPLLENFTSQTAVYERLFEDSTFQQVVYERLPAFVPISEKEEALPATSFFSDKSVHSVKTSETLIRGFEGAHATFLDLALEGKMPETLEETKEILWKEKNLTAAEHDHFYQGIMDDEAVEKLLAAYDPGYVVMHHHPEKEDIVFSYKEQNGNITEFFVGEDSVEIVMDKLIKDGKLFILNPEKEKLFKEVEKNSYYHGVMDDKAVDAILEVFDPGYVVMHHHPEKEDIVFSYKEQNGNITEFFVGEDSVETVMDKLIKDGKLFILNPEKEKLFKEMEKNPYYHETRTKEFAADALEANEAMIHYDPESKEVLITSCDKDGIFDHFVFDKKQSVAGLKEELEKEGIKLISRDDLEIKNAKPAVREKPVSNDQKVESTDNHLSAAEFLHRLTQKKVNGYLNKFDKGIIWWQDGKDGKVFFSYKIDGFIKTVAKDEFAKDLPILKENHHCLLRPRDLNKIIRKTLPAR